jgi:hypothetical protein
VPYDGVYACYAYAQADEGAADDLDVALLNSRICDLPDAAAVCFPHRPQRCHEARERAATGLRSVCDEIGADGAFGTCRGQDADTAIYSQVVTTYLNEPCDLTRNAEQCLQLRKTLEPAREHTACPCTSSPGTHRCGAGEGDGWYSVLVAWIAVVLAFFVLIVVAITIRLWVGWLKRHKT